MKRKNVVKKYKSGRHFEMVKGRNLILRTKVGPISPYSKPEFEVGTSTGFRVIRTYVQNLYRPTDGKRSEIGPILFIFASRIDIRQILNRLHTFRRQSNPVVQSVVNRIDDGRYVTYLI